MGVLEAAKMTGELIAPFNGSIEDRNHAALEDPFLVNQDPYGKGWLLLIKNDNWQIESKRLITGKEVEEWSKIELERYRNQGWIE